jgi:hypothetical protein
MNKIRNTKKLPPVETVRKAYSLTGELLSID